MKIEANLTNDDYKSLRRYIFFNYRKTYLFYVILIPVIIYAVWPPSESETIIEKISYVIVSLSFFIGIFAFLLLAQFLIKKAFRSDSKSVIGTHIFEIKEDTFYEKNNIGMVEAKYSSFKHIGQTKSHLFLFLNSGSAFVVPKRAFLNSDQLEEFIQQLKSKIASN